MYNSASDEPYLHCLSGPCQPTQRFSPHTTAPSVGECSEYCDSKNALFVQFGSDDDYENNQNGVCTEKCASGVYEQRGSELVCRRTKMCKEGQRRIADGEG